jgi:hypothetical protein
MTDDPRLLELIQADLDGRLDGADKAELARQLLADPAARRLHDELRRTDALLLDLPRAEPPEGLRSSIQAALGLSDHNRGGGRAADGGLGWRLAAAVVAGLVVVGLGYGLLSERRDTTDLQGSIAQSASAPILVDEATLPAGNGMVTAQLFREGQQMRLVIGSSSLQLVQVVGRYDPALLEPQAPAAAGEVPGQFSTLLRTAGKSESLEFSGNGAFDLEVRATGQLLGTVVLAAEARN